MPPGLETKKSAHRPAELSPHCCDVLEASTASRSARSCPRARASSPEIVRRTADRPKRFADETPDRRLVEFGWLVLCSFSGWARGEKAYAAWRSSRCHRF